jgi:hypothetical protein
MRPTTALKCLLEPRKGFDPERSVTISAAFADSPFNQTAGQNPLPKPTTSRLLLIGK